MELPQIDQYRRLFIDDTAMLDVRAPVEFRQGAFPHAVNMPLLNDGERQAVGLRYKEQGQNKAIELGHQLVSGAVKKQRVADWIAFTKRHPQGVLYCFRGGMRSKISQQWIYDQIGITIPRVKGGYKALRNYLLNGLQNVMTQSNMVILGGRTGSGKTRLLQTLIQAVDLERIFQHRGSAFGKYIHEQPSQISIENALAVKLLKLHHRAVRSIVVEDEAPNIGSRRIPDAMVQVMQQCTIVLLETAMADRVDNIFQEYIVQSLADYQQTFGSHQGFQQWSGQLQQALARIQKRLGGFCFKTANAAMRAAFDEQRDHTPSPMHKTWIEMLLKQYYDPMYDFQLSKKNEHVAFRGEPDAVRHYLQLHHGIG